jgi:hypothetical protein
VGLSTNGFIGAFFGLPLCLVSFFFSSVILITKGYLADDVLNRLKPLLIISAQFAVLLSFYVNSAVISQGLNHHLSFFVRYYKFHYISN